jgi:hypothetical protein
MLPADGPRPILACHRVGAPGVLTRLCVLATAALLTVAGCAFGPPLVPVRNSDERLHFNGFSLLPPSGASWHWVGTDQQDKGRLFSTTFVKKEGSSTCIAQAGLLDSEGRQFPTPDDLLAFMRGQERFKEAGRQRNLRVDFRIESTLGPSCVRFDGVAEDHEAPGHSGSVLDLDFHGYTCVHPATSGVIGEISYSGRTPKGRPHVARPEEAEHFLRSMLFTEVRRQRR